MGVVALALACASSCFVLGGLDEILSPERAAPSEPVDPHADDGLVESAQHIIAAAAGFAAVLAAVAALIVRCGRKPGASAGEDAGGAEVEPPVTGDGFPSD